MPLIKRSIVVLSVVLLLLSCASYTTKMGMERISIPETTNLQSTAIRDLK